MAEAQQATTASAPARPDAVPCAFCEMCPKRIIYQDQYCIAVRDGFPVSEGHSLIICRRHVASFFDTSAEERAALMQAIDTIKNGLDKEFSPDAYNIGINDGPEAGQTVPHLHIHLIPRYNGDTEDPRGGVRWIIPEKAAYWGREDD